MIEIEFKAGTSKEEIARQEREQRKNILAKQMGISRDKFDELLEGFKGFLTQAEKKARSEGSSTVHYVN